MYTILEGTHSQFTEAINTELPYLTPETKRREENDE
jgi:hypothetical protein